LVAITSIFSSSTSIVTTPLFKLIQRVIHNFITVITVGNFEAHILIGIGFVTVAVHVNGRVEKVVIHCVLDIVGAMMVFVDNVNVVAEAATVATIAVGSGFGGTVMAVITFLVALRVPIIPVIPIIPPFRLFGDGDGRLLSVPP